MERDQLRSFSDQTDHVPRPDPRYFVDEKALAAQVKENLFGQDDLIEWLASEIHHRMALASKMGRRTKPIAVFFFAGPPGVGKTEVACRLAEALYGSLNHLHHIDIGAPVLSPSRISDRGIRLSADSIKYARRVDKDSQLRSGAPPAEIRYVEGELCAALRSVPRSIVVIDQIEKMPPEAMTRLIALWRGDEVQDAQSGEMIDASEAIFVLTSNVAWPKINALTKIEAPAAEIRETLVRALSEIGVALALELFARVDEVFAFKPLKRVHMVLAAELQYKLFAEEYFYEIARDGIPMELLFAVEEFYFLRPEFQGGVRDIAGGIRNMIVDELLDGDTLCECLLDGKRIAFTVAADDGRVKVVPASGKAMRRANEAPHPALWLDQRIFGQYQAISQLSVLLRRNATDRLRLRAAGHWPSKPIGVFLFVGAPVSGKTEMARQLAHAHFGSSDCFHHFDFGRMGSQPCAELSLFGAPDGPVGDLPTALRRQADAVVFFREIQKASPAVIERLLDACSRGYVQDERSGHEASTSDAIVIFHSNTCAREIGDLAARHTGTADEIEEKVKALLANAEVGAIPPPLLARVDGVLAFETLQAWPIARIVQQTLTRLARTYELEVTAECDTMTLIATVERLMAKSSQHGLREIAREIEQSVADGLIDAKAGGAKRVRFEVDGTKVKVVPVKEGETTSTAASRVAKAEA